MENNDYQYKKVRQIHNPLLVASCLKKGVRSD